MTACYQPSTAEVENVTAAWKNQDYESVMTFCTELQEKDSSSVTWTLCGLAAAQEIQSETKVQNFADEVLKRDTTNPIAIYAKAQYEQNAPAREAAYKKCLYDARLPMVYKEKIKKLLNITSSTETIDFTPSTPNVSNICYVPGQKKTPPRIAPTTTTADAPKPRPTQRPYPEPVKETKPVTKTAKAVLDTSTGKMPQVVKSKYKEAEKAEDAGRYLDARKAFQECVKLGWDEADDDVARMYLRSKKYDAALRQIKSRHTVEALLVRLACEESQEDWDGAICTAQALTSKVKPSDMNLEGRLARALFLGDERQRGTDLAQNLYAYIPNIFLQISSKFALFNIIFVM